MAGSLECHQSPKRYARAIFRMYLQTFGRQTIRGTIVQVFKEEESGLEKGLEQGPAYSYPDYQKAQLCGSDHWSK